MENPAPIAAARGSVVQGIRNNTESSAVATCPQGCALPRAIVVELAGCFTASAAGITVERKRGGPICALARALVEAGHDPATLMRIMRGATLCFHPRPLGQWAGLTVSEGDGESRSARFRRYVPPEARGRSVGIGPRHRAEAASGHHDPSRGEKAASGETVVAENGTAAADLDSEGGDHG